ncbi:hypothetical protein [Paenibacillus qinlingensis]|uniref:Lipoprotein n=1 Tax=Paenibacillus qinlingensis TaxID=1837343 RepID=A0ABU1NS77_9BACL|nr:hypothetical protein [Paenibacillus qinlingensis]MDR6549921.1 hypothetical protein [Paenibacillus qinlingensis]
MKWLKTLILLASVSCMTGCTAHAVIDPTSEMSIQQQDDLKPIVKKLFAEQLELDEKPSVSASKRILQYKIHDEIQILHNDTDTYFIVSYDILPASMEFILAGGGERTENGWIINRKLYVTLQKNSNGQYQIKSLSSGP